MATAQPLDSSQVMEGSNPDAAFRGKQEEIEEIVEWGKCP
jgi:hypothetical protein